MSTAPPYFQTLKVLQMLSKCPKYTVFDNIYISKQLNLITIVGQT